jgi:phenylacetate-CoA ligase
MDVSMIARVLWLRRTLRGRERWSRAELEEHQRRQLAALRAFASARSPFYRRWHRGLARAPLADLPGLTKAVLMDKADQLATDPAVRLADVQRYLKTLHGNARFAGRYWVSATSGSSGRKSIIPSDVHEWAMVIASYGRANEWAGIRSGLLHRINMAPSNRPRCPAVRSQPGQPVTAGTESVPVVSNKSPQQGGLARPGTPATTRRDPAGQ